MPTVTFHTFSSFSKDTGQLFSGITHESKVVLVGRCGVFAAKHKTDGKASVKVSMEEQILLPTNPNQKQVTGLSPLEEFAELSFLKSLKSVGLSLLPEKEKIFFSKEEVNNEGILTQEQRINDKERLIVELKAMSKKMPKIKKFLYHGDCNLGNPGDNLYPDMLKQKTFMTNVRYLFPYLKTKDVKLHLFSGTEDTIAHAYERLGYPFQTSRSFFGCLAEPQLEIEFTNKRGVVIPPAPVTIKTPTKRTAISFWSCNPCISTQSTIAAMPAPLPDDFSDSVSTKQTTYTNSMSEQSRSPRRISTSLNRLPQLALQPSSNRSIGRNSSSLYSFPDFKEEENPFTP